MFETLGLYKILDRIGAGGLGEVYRARDTRLGRTVAIKVVSGSIAGDPDRRERLLRDARAATALSHPNIAALYEIGEDQDQLFLVFEYVPGETLKRTIAGRPLNPRRAIDLAVQIADALADAHAAGIVHRDLEPDNIIVTPKGNAKILDFGLAAWTAGGAARDRAALASADATPGKDAYLSPEQALGEQVDHRTDIFSLGIMLFEMLTGRLPFAATATTPVALQIVQAPVPVPSAVNKALPTELDPIVARAMAKSLDQRYASAVTLSADLRAVGTILDIRSDMQEPAAVFVPAQRTRSGGGGGRIALLAIVAAIGAGAWYERAALQQFWRSHLGSPPAPIIAVVPFESDPAQLFFADGLADDLTARLGQTPGLKVIGRSAVRQRRGRPPNEVARELGAAVVLTGSARPAGDSVKISLELIDPIDGRRVWSEQYTRDIKDIFALQAQAAEQVAAALGVKPQPTAASARAASRLVEPRAYELYLRGRQAASDRHLPEAIALYERAIAADAGLGEAFAGIVEALPPRARFSTAAAEIARRRRVEAAARRAYELDPDLPAANLAMGAISDTLGDTLKYFRHAVDLDPSAADSYRLVGDELQDIDAAQAVAFFQKSLLLDPTLDASRAGMASALGLLGRDEDARSALNAMSRPDADPQLTARKQALADFREGRDARAAAAMAARAPDTCEAKAALAALAFDRRDTAAAHRLADGFLSQAQLETASPPAIRCGLHAAAALQSSGLAAALLDRIGASEPALRAFAAVVDGRSGSMWIDPRAYPWSQIARQPLVAEARQRLDAAYTRQREIARAVLKGLP
jgi:TolB-like protein